MSSLNSTALLIIAGAVAAAFAIDYFLGYNVDAKEPPLVKPKIPYIGHVIGLVLHGNDYYKQLCIKHKLPIFTIPLVTGKAYVISDPDLALATQRSSKTISFHPFSTQFTKNVCKCNERQVRVLSDNITGPESDKNIVVSVTKDMHHTLAPGADLDEMNQKMIDTLVPRLNNFKPGKQGTTISLHSWIKQLITDVSTDAFYGKENPFKDPKVSDGFWEMEKDIIKLMLPGGKYLVPKAHQGREDLISGFEEYFQNGGPDNDGSATIKARFHGHMRYADIELNDNARFELGVPFGLLANSVPSTFWYCLHAYSDPSILSALRSELDASITTTHNPQDNTTTRTLDLSLMRTSCPLFLSLFQEVLRTRSTTALNRLVVEDMIFADRYLLKKDALVSMPTQVTHRQTQIWGGDAEEFDARRMMNRKLALQAGTGNDTVKSSSGEQEPGGNRNGKAKRLHAAGFRAFGAAPWLCPGRHFATTEILVFVAALLVSYDMQPLPSDKEKEKGKCDGEWIFPKSGSSIFSSVLPPDSDMSVCVRLRDGVEEGDRLEVVISEGGGIFGLPV